MCFVNTGEATCGVESALLEPVERIIIPVMCLNWFYLIRIAFIAFQNLVRTVK